MDAVTEAAAWVLAGAELAAAATLVAFAVVARDWPVRALAVLVAVVIVLSTSATGVLFGVGGGEGIGAYGPGVTIVVAGAAVGAVLLAGTLLFTELVLPTLPSQRRRRDAVALSERSKDKRVALLRNLLRREHAKLRSVNEMHRYFELATKNSQITVLFQDATLKYRWVVNPRVSLLPDDVIGRSDEDVLDDPARALVVGHKRRALATNTTQTFELEVPGKDERAWFRIDVVPITDEDQDEPAGLLSTAIDITRSKRLDMMRTDLSRRLAETLQRFNLALRSERIMVFSQDPGLRYTWANSDETQVGSIIGRTDDEVLPPGDREPIMSLKLQVMETKRPASAEIGVGEGADRRWYDLHVEPNLKPDGSVSGITCASIDITHRKRNEEQMRLVMRELTHRTKNLLTVVIAIARQTSTQASTVEAFVPALIARLRALSAAQDLIVADEWAGVNIGDLVRVLIGQYVPPQSARVSIGGPPIILSPEASQNLGLAIHELAANAVQYGAFANTTGTLAVSWSILPTSDGDHLTIGWVERGGPIVRAPTTRGFGMTVIERNLSRALSAKVTMSFEETGLAVEITLPLSSVLPFASPDRVRLAQAL